MSNPLPQLQQPPKEATDPLQQPPLCLVPVRSNAIGKRKSVKIPDHISGNEMIEMMRKKKADEQAEETRKAERKVAREQKRKEAKVKKKERLEQAEKKLEERAKKKEEAERKKKEESRKKEEGSTEKETTGRDHQQRG